MQFLSVYLFFWHSNLTFVNQLNRWEKHLYEVSFSTPFSTTHKLIEQSCCVVIYSAAGPADVMGRLGRRSWPCKAKWQGGYGGNGIVLPAEKKRGRERECERAPARATWHGTSKPWSRALWDSLVSQHTWGFSKHISEGSVFIEFLLGDRTCTKNFWFFNWNL